MKKVILVLFLIFTSLQADANFMIKDKEGDRITLVKSDFKVLEFNKRIVDVLVSDSSKIEVLFLKNKKKPLQTIKLYAKGLGYSKLLITFADKSTLLNEVSIVQNFSKVIEVIKAINKDIEVYQANGKVILKGYTFDTQEKERIENIFKSAGVDIEKDLINLLEVRVPNKMIKLKLYVVEINNDKGDIIKNNWGFGFRDGKTDAAVTAITDDTLVSLTNINNMMTNSATLTGGLTLAASRIGSKFDVGLTLNYLKTNDVAKVLNETTLVTLVNKPSKFLSGGTLFVETATTSSDGQPVSRIDEIDYGLELNINVAEVINDKFISLEIETGKSGLKPDINNDKIIVDIEDKSIKTNVIIEDKSTIVLGGLINNNSQKNSEKIPFLGDIPILGKLFQSKDFKDGSSELIFFITPTIVDVTSNDQTITLEKKKIDIIPKKKDEVEAKEKTKKEITVNNKRALTNEELHNKRLNEIFGIN